MNKENASIHLKLAVFIVFSIFTCIASLFLFYRFFQKTAHDVHFVNVAGSQRMLSERILHYAKWIHALGKDEDRYQLKSAIEVFDKKLTILLEGGMIQGQWLPPAPPEVQDKLHETTRLWNEIKPDLKNLSHTDAASQVADSHISSLERKLMQLRNSMNAAVVAYEMRNMELRHSTFFSIILLALSGGLALFFSLWVFITYIRERNATEQRLRRANRKIQEANRLKSEFLANISHEIRTPMNGIIGLTDFVLETELKAEQREYLEIVKKSADSLLTLLNDLLDFSRLEAGKLSLECIPFHLRDCIDDTIKMMAFKAHSKHLELLHFIHPDIPRYVKGDPNRLRQVLVNLIGNAIKFTEKGEIFVDVKLADPKDHPNAACKQSEKNDVCLHFSIRDTGIGIPKEKLAIIFDKFRQVDGSITRRYGGTGLGLSICRALVQKMGGEIWVESELGRGSTFHFTVRFQMVDQAIADPLSEESDSVNGLRILLADDHETHRRILTQQLIRWEIHTTPARDANEALTILRRSVDLGSRYDLVIVDHDLDTIEGRPLVWHIRQIPAYRDIPIIILTPITSGTPILSDSNAAKTVQVRKPYKTIELLKAILYATGTRQTVKIVPSPNSSDNEILSSKKQSTTSPSLTILLAEDNSVNQLFIKKLLEKAGHRVQVASNGESVLKILQANHQHFDLILMDIQMPELDGFETCQRIRQADGILPKFRDIPIIALTAHAEEAYRTRCFSAGMNGFVTKPIRAQDLFQAIDEVMQESHQYELSKQ